MTNMTKRLEALEKASPANAAPARMIQLVVSRDEGETTAESIARWCAENPDQPPPAEEDVILLRALTPAPRPVT